MKRLARLVMSRSFYSAARRPQPIRPVILVHGGVAQKPDEIIEDSEKGVQVAAYVGYDALMTKGNALDAVYEAMRILEIHPKYGSPLNTGLVIDKNVKIDAAIMCGKRLKSTTITQIKNILHPIMLARKIMEQCDQSHLQGDDAAAQALNFGFVNMEDEDTLVTPKSLRDLAGYKNHLSIRCGVKGTVGAVAVDANGNVAAATVSGGGVGEIICHSSETPLIGSGLYADNNCGAAVFTVESQSPVRFNAAARVKSLMQNNKLSPQEAVKKVVKLMQVKFAKSAGGICVDNCGRVGIYHTAGHMSWAYRCESELHYGTERHQRAVRFFN